MATPISIPVKNNKVYLDTSVISALFDTRTPERMFQTETAWRQVTKYSVYLSEIVIEELEKNPEPLRSKMLDAIKGFIVLPVTETAQALADIYVKQGIFPEKYYDDALHVAIASANHIGIILSWNFTHLVKLKTRRMVVLINTMEDFLPVEIISPPEL
jgi:predicted nucleic acid-binding protein